MSNKPEGDHQLADYYELLLQGSRFTRNKMAKLQNREQNSNRELNSSDGRTRETKQREITQPKSQNKKTPKPKAGKTVEKKKKNPSQRLEIYQEPDEELPVFKKVKSEAEEKSHQLRVPIQKPTFFSDCVYDHLNYQALSPKTLKHALAKIVYLEECLHRVMSVRLLELRDDAVICLSLSGTQLSLDRDRVAAILLCTGFTQTSIYGKGWLLICFYIYYRSNHQILQELDSEDSSSVSQEGCYTLKELLSSNSEATQVCQLCGTNQYKQRTLKIYNSRNLNHVLYRSRDQLISTIPDSVNENYMNKLSLMIQSYNQWIQRVDNVKLQVEDTEKEHRIIKYNNSYAVILRTLREPNGQFQLLIRTFSGKSMWVYYPQGCQCTGQCTGAHGCEIKTTYLMTDVAMENLCLTDQQIDENEILMDYLLPGKKHFTQFLRPREDIDLRRKRCDFCHIILSWAPHYQCSICHLTVHQHCHERSPNTGTFHSKSWVCAGCQPCSICWCQSTPELRIEKCIECQAGFHLECGFSWGTPKASHYYCPQCIKCQWCQKVLKNLKHSIVGGELLCSECEGVKQRQEDNYGEKNYCLMCKTVWANNQEEYEKEYIQCVSQECSMWVHKDCDVVLRNAPQLFRLYSRESSRVYRCPRCRDQIRNLIISDTIRFLSYFDVDKSLWMIDNRNTRYLEVIKTPMDFVTLYQKNQMGEYQQSIFKEKNESRIASTPDIPSFRVLDGTTYRLLIRDIKLILENCLQYNLPNTKIHRRALMLQALYNIIMPILKQKLFDLEEKDIIEYSEQYTGLVNLVPNVMRECARYFLDEAFSSCLNQVSIICQPWDVEWERQTLGFSAALTPSDAESEARLLVKYERKINPAVKNSTIYNQLNLIDQDEPLIRFNFAEFSNQLLRCQMTIKINGIKGVLARSRVTPHPYIQYMLNNHQHSEPNETYSSQMDIEPEVRVRRQTCETSFGPSSGEQQSFETELQTFFNKLLQTDITKVKLPHLHTRASIELITEFSCQTCAGYEYRHNLLFCANCGDSHHFFCQIPNTQLVPQSVMQAHLSNVQKQWLCLKCITCTVCRRGNYRPNDLLCSLCGNFCHFRCIFPQFQPILEPIELWRCPSCFQCDRCKKTQYIDENNLELLQHGDECNEPICIEFFQGFQYCLLCGMINAKSRYCEVCKEYVYMDGEKEIVNAVTGRFLYESSTSTHKNAYRQSLRPEFWELSRRTDTYLSHFIEDINTQCKLQDRTPLQYLVKQTLRDQSTQCKKCFKRFHIRCVKQFDSKGQCAECSLDFSEVLFKYEKCKQEQVKSQYQERKLRQLQPYLVSLIELLQNIPRRRLMSRSTFEWPPLSEVQKQAILENLDIFETQISAFQTSYSSLQEIKKELFREAQIKEEFLDRLIHYWSIRHGSLELPDFLTFSHEKDLMLAFNLYDDSSARILERQMIQQGYYTFYLTHDFMTSYSSYATKLFRRGFFTAFDAISSLTSALQCNLVTHLQQTPLYQYVTDEFYGYQSEIIVQSPVQLLNYTPGLSTIKCIRYGFCVVYWKFLSYKSCRTAWIGDPHQSTDRSSLDRPLRATIGHLQNSMRDDQINEHFKQIMVLSKNLSITVLEMRETFSQGIKEINERQNAPSPVTKPIPQEQAEDTLERINSMIKASSGKNKIVNQSRTIEPYL